MGFSYIGSVNGVETANDTSIDCSSALDINEGDLLICTVKWDGATTTITSVQATSGAANTLTMGTVTTHSLDYASGAVGYKIAASNNDTATFRLTLAASRAYKSIIIMQFRPDASETVSVDAQDIGAWAFIDTPQSPNINTAETDEVVLGWVARYTRTQSGDQIGDAAADAAVSTGEGYGSLWYKIYTETKSGIHAQATLDDYGHHVCGIIAFKSIAAGGSIVPQAMMYYAKLCK